MNRLLEIQSCSKCLHLVHGKTKWICEILEMEIKSDVATEIPIGCPLPFAPEDE